MYKQSLINHYNDSYFEADLIEQFRVGEADYQTCVRTGSIETCKESRGRFPGDEIEALGISDNESEDELSDSELEQRQEYDVSKRGKIDRIIYC